MLKKTLSTICLGVLGTVPLLALAWVYAENQTPAAPAREEAPERQLKLQHDDITVLTPSSYWIGVQVVPVPDLLVSHFTGQESKDGLVAVEQVVADSPAAESGVRRGDVILRFSGQDIHSLHELVRLVAESKETEQDMTVVRDGKRVEFKITPKPRPNRPISMSGSPRFQGMPIVPPPGMRMGPDIWIGPRDPQKMMKEMEDYFRQMQGGIDGEQLLALPEDEAAGLTADSTDAMEKSAKRLEVSSKTDTDGKTSIHVKQYVKEGDSVEEKSWEASEIDELPEEIRGEVKKLFGR